MRFHAIVLTAAFLIPAAAYASDECEKRTSYDKTYCMAKLFVESDKELNSTYNELRGKIGAASKEQLKSTQVAWIRHRDNACEAYGTIDVDCNYRVNRERAEYLRDRLRECKAGTCRSDMIVKRSW